MQRIAPTLSLCGRGNGSLRRSRQQPPGGAIGIVAPVGIKTLAASFIQALPVLDGVPTAYSHEFHAELIYDLCAALVREGLGKPETWQECGENAQVTVTASAEELDRDLPATLVSFVGAHLGLKNSLDRAKAEMDAAAKAAQAEARSKSKTSATKVATKSEVTKPAEAPRPAPQAAHEPARTASLFDAPAAVPNSDMDEEEEILAEVGEEDEASEEIDEAA